MGSEVRENEQRLKAYTGAKYWGELPGLLEYLLRADEFARSDCETGVCPLGRYCTASGSLQVVLRITAHAIYSSVNRPR